MNPRIQSELALLRQSFASVEHVVTHAMHWFRVYGLKVPDGWSASETGVVFAVSEGHPGAEPYGFFVSKSLTKNGSPPSESSFAHPPPFDGEWRFLSWSPVGWRATADLRSGSNLLNWVMTFPHRLREGV